jgi:chorismate mutase
MADDFVVVEPLPLSAIRATLIRLEETIIFGLIERAQFAQNSPAYDAVCVHFWWFC